MPQLSTRVVAIALAVVSVSIAWAQNNYPVIGQPQGGDRRGTYFDAKGRPDDKTIPLFKDPKIYLGNMTLLAYLPEVKRGPQMMTIGGKRYLVGGGAVTDVTDPKNPVVINDKAPGGQLAYNQSLKKWILMRPTDANQATQAQLQSMGKIPNPELNPKGFLGATFFDMTDPRNPVEISRFETKARGVHTDGVFYDGGRYAYLASGLGTRGQHPFHLYNYILQIIDVSDIKNPKEVSKWWVPGQMKEEQKEFESWPEAGPHWNEEIWNKDLIYHFSEFHGPCFVPKRVEDGGNRGYCSWGQHGFITLDLSDIQHPKQIGRLDISPPFEGGIPVHTAYPMPERKLVFINSEPTYQDCYEGVVPPFVVDVRSEKNPVTIATFPLPKPPAEAPYNDFCFRGHRFGTHNSQDIKAPGEARVDLMAYTWFAGGFRLYDVSNPFQPREVAFMIPKQGEARGTETVLIEWDRKLVHVFADSGLYILSTPVLGEPILGPLKPQRWTLQGLNVGAP